MNIGRINHVQVTIPTGAEDAARAFYCDLLGLREINKPESLKSRGGLWLQVGEQQVHLGIEDGADRSRSRAHIAYEVDDLVAWRQRLGAAGTKIEDSIPIPCYDRFECRDPFGNRIEFIQPVVEGTARKQHG